MICTTTAQPIIAIFVKVEYWQKIKVLISNNNRFFCDCAENKNTKCKLMKEERTVEENISKNKDGVAVIKGRCGLGGGDTGLIAGGKWTNADVECVMDIVGQ